MEIWTAWQACLEEAWAAYRAGSVPIGAAYVDRDGWVRLRGRNRSGEEAAPRPFVCASRVAHAEVNVLAQVPAASHAEMATGVLYTTLEPCPMCFGAALMVGVRQIRYGARDRWAGAANLQAASPYVASKDMRILGPEPLVQAVSLVLLTEHTLRGRSPRTEELVAAFAAEDERAVELGREFRRTGYLEDAARDGVTVEVLAREIWRELGLGEIHSPTQAPAGRRPS